MHKDDPAAELRADIFYPIIARAITQLPSKEYEARQTFYDRARAVLTSELHGRDPLLIAHERRALEMAIRRVESEPQIFRSTKSAVVAKTKMPLLPKLLLSIMLGAMITGAVAQLPIRWRKLLIWCCGI